jgi:hypothetical protein
MSKYQLLVEVEYGEPQAKRIQQTVRDCHADDLKQAKVEAARVWQTLQAQGTSQPRVRVVEAESRRVVYVLPKIHKSEQGRLRWQPGDPHPLDDLFPYAREAQRDLTVALERLQETVRQFAARELAQTREALPQTLSQAELGAEQAAYSTFKNQKHYQHAQALLAYLRRQQMAARCFVAQAAVDLATELLSPDPPAEDSPDLFGQLGSARDWRKRVAQFERHLTEVREQFQRSEGYFETKMVRRGNKLHGPYRVYRWREADGRLYTVHLGRTDYAHGEAPQEFVAGAWEGYQVFTKQQPARSPEELLIAGLRWLAQQSAWSSRSDRKFGKSLLEQSQKRPLSVEQLRALYRLLERYQTPLEDAEPDWTLPDLSLLEDSLAQRQATSDKAALGQIDADASTYLVRFPYEEEQVRQINAIWKKHGGKGWRPAQQVWQIGGTAGPDLFAGFPEFERTETALTLQAEMQAETQAKVEAEARAREQTERACQAWAAFRRGQLRQLDLRKPLKSGRVLFAHQREAVQWLLEHGQGILADDLGLGKTTSALVAAKALELPILVICPVTLKENWLAEARLVDVSIQPHSWAKVPVPPETEFVLICDEASYAQTWDAQRTQAMIRLARAPQCRAIYLLSGTPIKG